MYVECYCNMLLEMTLKWVVPCVILIVYQKGIKKYDDTRQSLENHAKVDEIRRFLNKKFDSSHGVHRAIVVADEYSKPTKRGDYQFFSGVMGVSYNHFLSKEAGTACMKF